MKLLASRSLPIVAILIGVVVFSVAYRWGRRSAHPNLAASDSALRPANDGTPFPSPFRIAGDSMAPTLVDGDVCQLVDFGTLQIGDVVAIRWGGKRHVKRVAAVGGDVVDRVAGRLTVGGQICSPSVMRTSFSHRPWFRSVRTRTTGVVTLRIPAVSSMAIAIHTRPVESLR